MAYLNKLTFQNYTLKIAFLSTSSKYESLHPSSFDDGVLRDADVVIVSDLRKSGEREGAANDGMVEKMLNKVCGNVGEHFYQICAFHFVFV